MLICFSVGENYKTDGYDITPNTMELLKQHLLETKGQVNITLMFLF